MALPGSLYLSVALSLALSGALSGALFGALSSALSHSLALSLSLWLSLSLALSQKDKKNLKDKRAKGQQDKMAQRQDVRAVSHSCDVLYLY